MSAIRVVGVLVFVIEYLLTYSLLPGHGGVKKVGLGGPSKFGSFVLTIEPVRFDKNDKFFILEAV